MWTEDITTASRSAPESRLRTPNYRINQSQVLFLETGVRDGDLRAGAARGGNILIWVK